MSQASPPLLPLVLDRVPLGLRQALAQEGIPSTERRAARIDGRYVLFDSRSGPCAALGRGQLAVDVHALRRQWRRDPFEDLLDERTARLSWTLGALDATEEVAQVEKREVRRGLMTALRVMLEARGGVWLKVGAFPFPYRSAFNLRFDHDAFVAGEFELLLQTLSGCEEAASHYVCGVAFEPYPKALAKLRGSDVGSHGYLHHTYQDPDDNLRNIRRGIELLARAGIEAHGFAAPFGRFNLGLLNALEALGVTHSSEFGLAYDDLPFYPGGGHLLQIPIHPVSLGMFADALATRAAGSAPDDSSQRVSNIEAVARAAEAITGHFRSFAVAQYQAGEPIFLYGQACGHPGFHPSVVRAAIETSRELAAVWRTTLSAFNQWWRARETVRLRVFEHEGRYRVVVDSRPAAYRIAGEYWRGEHVAVVPLDDPVVTLVPESLAFQGRRVEGPPLPVRIDCAENLRGRSRRTIAGEAATLIEANSPGWRNWVRRALRRIND